MVTAFLSVMATLLLAATADYAPVGLSPSDVPTKPPAQWSASYAKIYQLSEALEVPAIIVVSSKNCVPCRSLWNTTLQDDTVKGTINGHYVLAWLSIESPKNAAFVKDCNITATPTTVLLDGKQNVIRQYTGYMSPGMFQRFLRGGDVISELIVPQMYPAGGFIQGGPGCAGGNCAGGNCPK